MKVSGFLFEIQHLAFCTQHVTTCSVVFHSAVLCCWAYAERLGWGNEVGFELGTAYRFFKIRVVTVISLVCGKRAESE